MTSLDPVFRPSNGSGVWLLVSHCIDLGFDGRPLSAVFVVDKVALGQVFIESTLVLPFLYHSSNVLSSVVNSVQY